MVFLKKRWLYFLLLLLALFAVFAVLQRPAPVQYITSPVRYGKYAKANGTGQRYIKCGQSGQCRLSGFRPAEITESGIGRSGSPKIS